MNRMHKIKKTDGKAQQNIGKPNRAHIQSLKWRHHYNDVIMSARASQTTGPSIVYSAVCSAVDQSKHQSSASLAFVRGIHLWPVNSPHEGPVTRRILPFDDAILTWAPWHFKLLTTRRLVQQLDQDNIKVVPCHHAIMMRLYCGLYLHNMISSSCRKSRSAPIPDMRTLLPEAGISGRDK